ncbi:MAG: flagellar export chaperone FlgN [Clostridiales bacterium]|nr:flagellar export chaperone FlgN [Clostridiales bacterium]
MRGEECTNKLVKKSEQKLALLNKLFELTVGQSTAVEKPEENIAKLTELIDNKQEVINKINVLDSDFVDEYEALKAQLGIKSLEQYDAKSNDELKKLLKTTEEVTLLTRKIKKIDDENVRKMGLHINQTKRELKNVKNSMKIAKSYGKKNDEVYSVFIDKKS